MVNGSGWAKVDGDKGIGGGGGRWAELKLLAKTHSQFWCAFLNYGNIGGNFLCFVWYSRTSTRSHSMPWNKCSVHTHMHWCSFASPPPPLPVSLCNDHPNSLPSESEAKSFLFPSPGPHIRARASALPITGPISFQTSRRSEAPPCSVWVDGSIIPAVGAALMNCTHPQHTRRLISWLTTAGNKVKQKASPGVRAEPH